ncbi:hypothetical protein [Polyangium jinanense]|uniref:HEAT repeat protein n=1 Tax=Polyangium jinanense TaxID=2829994 RepID=A0A9X3XEI0_9BACT|nr:hypothetical protein [Polyangium jinanense]MDC3959616.1 hypothetical protein [Polyangium jinanense]MDC3986536.1 hypothetical protein [Polyangium jinanense]
MTFVPLVGIDAIIAKLNAPAERALATEELAQLGPSTIPYLVEAARGTWKNAWGVPCENDLQIRTGAVIALSRMGAAASEALPVLEALVAFAPLRRELVQAFAAIKEGSRRAEVVESCTAALVQLQKDPDPEVRCAAERALRGPGPRDR